MYLASSDTDPDKPYRRGFSFEELRKRMENTVPTKVVVILDCCYSGSAKISKGNEEDTGKDRKVNYRTEIKEATRRTRKIYFIFQSIPPRSICINNRQTQYIYILFACWGSRN